MTAPPRLRVAYLTSTFPSVSHTFVQREVAALREHDVEVHTFSVRRASAAQVLSAADEESLRTTQALLPSTATDVARAHLGALARSPRAYVRTFGAARRYAAPGPRGLLYQLFYFGEAILLWRACRARGVRHVHAHFANNGADIARLARDYGRAADSVPWSWSFTMHGPTEFSDVSRFALRAKASSADFVACISDFARSQLMALVPQEQWDHLSVVHCGVDPERFAPAVAKQERPAAGLRVLCVGRLVPEKGQSVLLAAVERLRAQGTDVEVRLVGDGPDRAVLEARTARRGLSAAVTFLGAVGQDDIAESFAWADVLCLPSFAEGVPVVLMEAMACGLPVVATRIAGVPELVDHERSGIVVAPGRPELVADALASLAADPALREEMGRHGRARVVDDYSSRTAVEPLIRLFRDLAPGARVPLVDVATGPPASGRR